MRVLRLCSAFEPPPGAETAARFDPVGGMQFHTGQLTRALDDLGVGQTVVTAWRPGAARCQRLGQQSQVRWLGIGVPWGRQLWSAGAWRAVPELAADADVVHAHLGEDLAVVPLARRAARAHGLPLVLTVHLSLAHTLERGWRTALLCTAGAALERRGERSADAVIVLTGRLARRLVDEGIDPGRVHVIPSGVDPRLFAAQAADPAPTLGRPRILYVGRLAPQKGVATLVHAAAHLRSPAFVLVVGDGPDRPELERLAGRLGVADRVRFTGFVPHHDVPAHLRHADVLVLPSVYEELGSALVEGMHAGLPTVASAVGGIPDLVEDGVTGRLVPPGDAGALAAALDDLLTDPSGAAAMGAAGRARAQRLAWPALAQRTLAVYRSVAGRSRPAEPAGA